MTLLDACLGTHHMPTLQDVISQAQDKGNGVPHPLSISPIKRQWFTGSGPGGMMFFFAATTSHTPANPDLVDPSNTAMHDVQLMNVVLLEDLGTD